MRGVYRILLTAITVLLCLSFISCDDDKKDREYNEAEVIAAAEELLDMVKSINEIYYGKGFEYDEGESIGIYKRATDESLLKFGIGSVEELKAVTKQVYSDSRAEIMFDTVLEAVSDDGVIRHYARYYDHKGDDGESFIMVNSQYSYHLTGDIEYLPGIRVSDVDGEVIIITVPVRLTSDKGKIKDTTLQIGMIEEDDGWRFSTPTHAVYNESSDAYEDLLDKLN